MKTFKRVAFTLAEVLIAIGIIGVVAAITMPTLVKNYQKKVAINQLKKAYAELNQAIKLAEVEYGETKDWDFSLNTTQFFNTYLTNYMKIANTDMGKIKNKGIQYYEISGKPETNLTLVRNNNSSIIVLNSGYTIMFTNGSNTLLHDFFIDINGYNKGPNTFGKDTFVFRIWKNYGLKPHCQDDGDLQPLNCNNRNKLLNQSGYGYNCNKNSRGLWCGALIMMDGWKIPKDYPW